MFRKIHGKTLASESILLKKTLSKKRFQHRCFPVNFAKFLSTSFFAGHYQWLLLEIIHKQLSDFSIEHWYSLVILA